MNTSMAARHRARFLADLDGAMAILPTGRETIRSRDTHYRFRPDSDFYYLTAFTEPDAVAVFAPHSAEGPFILFVRPRDPEMEVWNGRRAGVEGAKEIYGANTAHPIAELDARLPALLKGASKLYFATGRDADFDRKILGWNAGLSFKSRDGITGPHAVLDPSDLLHEARLFKSDDELALMRRAASITDEAHRAAMKTVAPGVMEYEVEAVVDGTFRRRGGWGPGYTTIAASGDGANVLHYVTNDRPAGEGDLFLLDAGCEYGGYTADVTRTFPVSGRFSDAQRELYEVVLAAQLAAVAHVRPGVTFQSVHETALEHLIEGMIAIELLRGTVEENIASESYKRYYMHKTSHWLGLDVHDVGRYHVDAATNGSTPKSGGNGKASRLLAPGMVLTVEPGLYVPASDELAPERFRGNGIRIEDDILVTADGRENLTAAIPKTVAEVEAAW